MSSFGSGIGFANYTELKAAIGTQWLNRSDLTERIPSFVALAEEDIRSDLRRETIREPLTINSNVVPLPVACEELRSVRFNTTSWQHSLDMKTYAALSALRNTGSGRPHYGAVVDGVLLLDIAPDGDYTAEIVYFAALTALSDTNPTNNTLLDHPSIYLYGSLIHSAPYLEHDDRLPTWVSMYDRAVAKANKRREESELGSAPLSAGLPVVF